MNLRSPVPSLGLLDELQSTLAHGPVARRVETLRRVTDLFLTAAADYSDEQIALFDDVLQCLIRQIETSAKALLARRLAPISNAPPLTVRALAFDDAIEVAGPVLALSERLNNMTLVEVARTKSQAHLAAISSRTTLSSMVTDVLVVCGNDQVVRETLTNTGAAISDHSFEHIISRADGNDELAACVGMCPTIPRHLYLKLVAKASDAVRTRLEAAHPPLTKDISSAVTQAAWRARSSSAPLAEQTVIAHGLVKSLYEDGRVDDGQVATFANAGKFDETNAALACLANLPLPVAETLMVEAKAEGILILAKAAGLSWPTVRAIILLREKVIGNVAADLVACKETYDRLRLSTAQQTLRFHRMQQSTPPAA